MSSENDPELSVVVPVLNEEGILPSFLAAMARQSGVGFELILSDGGSTDGGVELAERLAENSTFAVRVIRGARGRGAQLNLGAEKAAARTLLFLHADSSFPDPLSLRKGLDQLSAAAADGGRVAGHFSLEFDFGGEIPRPYRFYGAKAALDRPGCTHGDQGFLIGADFFRGVGPFDVTLPVLEDTLLAERVRVSGRWLLLSPRIRTSPRRFLSEGLLARQTLNAMVMNLAAIGEPCLIRALRDCYRCQGGAKKLELGPFLQEIGERLSDLPRAKRRRLWRATGAYVRSNAWQVPFFLDFLFGGLSEGEGGSLLRLHDRLIGRLIDNRFGDACAALLSRGWFRAALFRSRSLKK